MLKDKHPLVLCMINGRGVEQDDAEAVKWYRLAAEQGRALPRKIISA